MSMTPVTTSVSNNTGCCSARSPSNLSAWEVRDGQQGRRTQSDNDSLHALHDRVQMNPDLRLGHSVLHAQLNEGVLCFVEHQCDVALPFRMARSLVRRGKLHFQLLQEVGQYLLYPALDVVERSTLHLRKGVLEVLGVRDHDVDRVDQVVDLYLHARLGGLHRVVDKARGIVVSFLSKRQGTIPELLWGTRSGASPGLDVVYSLCDDSEYMIELIDKTCARPTLRCAFPAASSAPCRALSAIPLTP